MVSPTLPSALRVLLTPMMAAQFYAFEQIKNNPGLSDYAKNAISERVDFLMGPLEQEVKQIGLGKPHAQALENATMLASARIEDLKTAYAKSNAAKATAEPADTLGITPQQYTRLADSRKADSALRVSAHVDHEDGKGDRHPDHEDDNDDSGYEEANQIGLQTEYAQLLRLLEQHGQVFPFTPPCLDLRTAVPPPRSNRASRGGVGSFGDQRSFDLGSWAADFLSASQRRPMLPYSPSMKARRPFDDSGMPPFSLRPWT